ncbi:hypothetical protein CARUB_v10024469mg [Capsella rubella]|uniref:Uncharacterized protein n=1 Tax=Capsella rubella TaxID=81985 RepID=R0HSC9_9BRAS|nr:hypothetical protein CARUB_v10024469mg [Capsella rubella]
MADHCFDSSYSLVCNGGGTGKSLLDAEPIKGYHFLHTITPQLIIQLFVFSF